jgi:hypothetical protein
MVGMLQAQGQAGWGTIPLNTILGQDSGKSA